MSSHYHCSVRMLEGPPAGCGAGRSRARLPLSYARLLAAALALLLPRPCLAEPALVETFCVSLPQHAERRLALTANFLGVLNISFVTGVRGRDVAPLLATSVDAVPDNVEHSPRDSPEFLGALGCTVSHLLALSAAYARGLDYALILEDDVVPDLVPFWREDLPHYVHGLPRGWSIAQLALIGDEAMWDQAYDGWYTAVAGGRWGPAKVAASTVFWSTAAYVVSRVGMAAILGRFQQPDGLNLSSLASINLDIQVRPPAGLWAADRLRVCRVTNSLSPGAEGERAARLVLRVHASAVHVRGGRPERHPCDGAQVVCARERAAGAGSLPPAVPRAQPGVERKGVALQPPAAQRGRRAGLSEEGRGGSPFLSIPNECIVAGCRTLLSPSSNAKARCVCEAHGGQTQHCARHVALPT